MMLSSAGALSDLGPQPDLRMTCPLIAGREGWTKQIARRTFVESMAEPRSGSYVKWTEQGINACHTLFRAMFVTE